MSAKTLAPIALGIGALYLFSTKGSPFEQQQQQDAGKPGGEHVGPPEPETTQTPNSKAVVPVQVPKKHIPPKYKVPSAWDKTKKDGKQVAVYRPAVAPPPVQKHTTPTHAATQDPKAAGGNTTDYLSAQTSQPASGKRT
jgi:hypothetical protein|tara:strand:+ start:36 stop:452 length:417 start_codon:yes stop_codon:yes gene_type:complete